MVPTVLLEDDNECSCRHRQRKNYRHSFSVLDTLTQHRNVPNTVTYPTERYSTFQATAATASGLFGVLHQQRRY